MNEELRNSDQYITDRRNTDQANTDRHKTERHTTEQRNAKRRISGEDAVLEAVRDAVDISDSKHGADSSTAAGGTRGDDSDSVSCEYMHAHPELIARVNEIMPEEEILYDLAELYKVFGDSTRIKILYVLFESEMCVCDLASCLNMTTSAISHQLRVLKQSQLVRFRREGKTVFYSLADDHVRTILDQGMEHICE